MDGVFRRSASERDGALFRVSSRFFVGGSCFEAPTFGCSGWGVARTNTASAMSVLRDAIVRAAYELVTSSGAEGVTMRGLANRVGLSTTALYQHFESKLDVLAEVRILGYEALNQSLYEAFRVSDPREAMLDACLRYVTFARENPFLYDLLFESDAQRYDDLTGQPDSDIGRQRQEMGQNLARKFAAFIGGGPPTIFFGQWWCFVHGLAALVVAGQFRSTHAVIPVHDVDGFIEDASRAFVDGLLGRT